MGGTDASERWGALAALLPLAYLPLLALEFLGRPLGSFDEPLLYVGARALRAGAWPHIDFASVYPPLNYLPVAASFSLLGETALAARVAQVLAYWLLLAALTEWFVSRGIRGVRLGLVLAATLALSAALPIQTSVFGVTLALLSLLLYLRGLALEVGRARAALMLGAGVCVGLGLFTRVGFGLYAAAALGAEQALELWRARGAGRGAQRALLIDAVPLWGSAALVVLAIGWVYGANVRDIYEQSVTALLRALASYAYAAPEFVPSLRGAVRFITRGWWLLAIPLTWLAWRTARGRERAGAWVCLALVLGAELALSALWPAALPLLIAPVAAAIAHRAAQPGSIEREEGVALLAVCCFAHYYLSRTDLSHQLPSTAALSLLLPLRGSRVGGSRGVGGLGSALPSLGASSPLAASPRVDASAVAPSGARAPRQLEWLEVAALAAFSLALAWPSIWSSRPTPAGVAAGMRLLAEHRSTSDAARVAAMAPGAALAALYPDAMENAVARLVRQQTGDAEPVYVGVSDHARPVISNMRLLWLIGRPLAARHFMLQSEISSTPAAQRSIVSDLDTRSVRWVVTWRPPDDGRATLARPLAAGPTLVDDFLRSRFREWAALGEFRVLRAHGAF